VQTPAFGEHSSVTSGAGEGAEGRGATGRLDSGRIPARVPSDRQPVGAFPLPGRFHRHRSCLRHPPAGPARWSMGGSSLRIQTRRRPWNRLLCVLPLAPTGVVRDSVLRSALEQRLPRHRRRHHHAAAHPCLVVRTRTPVDAMEQVVRSTATFQPGVSPTGHPPAPVDAHPIPFPRPPGSDLSVDLPRGPNPGSRKTWLVLF
jgi:hypothetical protein